MTLRSDGEKIAIAILLLLSILFELGHCMGPVEPSADYGENGRPLSPLKASSNLRSSSAS